jgi:nitrous oxidase accessory protein NosD
MSLFAKTHYVEKWGSDANPCTKTLPCLTIQHAIRNSKKNDKIVVGPGEYDENVSISQNSMGEDLEGLKIESSAGRWATFVTAVSPSAAAIAVLQPKVQIGKKGKGLTFQNSTNTAAVLFLSNAPGAKVEGNRMADSGWGLFIANNPNDLKNQIKNNITENNTENGFYCNGCYKALIQENQSRGNGDIGFYIFNAESMSFFKNIASNNGGTGLYVLGTNNNAKIKDNVFYKNAGDGMQTDNADGQLVQANIAGDNSVSGFDIFQTSFTKPQQVKNNLAAANTNDGFLINDGMSAKFDFNTAVSHGDDGIDVAAGADFSSFKNNNAIEDSCGLEYNGGSALKYVKLFVENDIVDLCGGGVFDPSSSFATKPNPLKAKVASKL